MVRFLSTSTIRTTTAHNDSIRRIEVTPWDLQHLMVGYIQRGHFPLDIFYPLAGRLAMIENNEDDTASFFIDCNNQGAQFVHAAADGITMADILVPIDDPQIVDSLLLMNNVLNYEGISTPIAGRANN